MFLLEFNHRKLILTFFSEGSTGDVSPWKLLCEYCICIIFYWFSAMCVYVIVLVVCLSYIFEKYLPLITFV